MSVMYCSRAFRVAEAGRMGVSAAFGRRDLDGGLVFKFPSLIEGPPYSPASSALQRGLHCVLPLKSGIELSARMLASRKVW